MSFREQRLAIIRELAEVQTFSGRVNSTGIFYAKGAAQSVIRHGWGLDFPAVDK
jgi:hypothetical protein